MTLLRRLRYGLALVLMAIDVAMSWDIATSDSPYVIRLADGVGLAPNPGWFLVGLAAVFVLLLILGGRWLFHDLRHWLKRTLES